ncbi:MAG: hypothetical protein GX241_07535 [Ruminococcaceae bacterium]|nr:hypothetical protein [Oscillospiraceae bacterium]
MENATVSAAWPGTGKLCKSKPRIFSFCRIIGLFFKIDFKNLWKEVQPGSFACGNEPGKYAKLQRG